jgi:integrase
MANETVTLLRYAKIPGLGWRRGTAIIGKTGKVTPDYMLLGKRKEKRKVHAPEGHYELRRYDGRSPRYKKLGNDPTEALDALERAQSELKLKNSANAIGYIIPSPVPVKQKSLAEYGRDFLELKRSPSLNLDEDTIKLYTGIVDEFVPLSGKFGKTHPEDIIEADVIRYCDELDKRYSDGVRARRYTSLRGFLFYCGLEPKRLITPSVHNRLKFFEKKKVRVYNAREIVALLAVCDPYHRALFLVALLAGLRDDELAHLLWQQVDFDANVIHLRSYEIQHMGRIVKFELKDREARDIPLFPLLRQELLQWQEKRPNSVFVLGTKNDQPNVKILDALKRKARKAGLNCKLCHGCAARNECHQFHTHYFRSSFASYALKAQNDIRKVMEWMGHSDLETLAQYIGKADNCPAWLLKLYVLPESASNQDDTIPPSILSLESSKKPTK